ncbi:McbB family protein (plasmid) [Pediococcus pentosaceus]|uniref:McbB family protein n=1 Tax=Pediococcus pentosaceus TaxID=1255 RepID=UPI003AF33E94
MKEETRKLPEYKILPFFLFEGKEKLVQTDNGIVVIKDPKLGELIKKWDTTHKRYLYTDELEKIFSTRTSELIEFLLSNRLLQKNSKKTLKIDKIIIFSDNEQIENQISEYLKSEFPVFPIQIIHTIEQIESLNQNDLLLVSLTKYSFEIAEIIRRKTMKFNNLLLFGHVYAGNYYIDNFYKKEWFLPCHKCIMGNLQAQLRMNNFGEETYQSVLDQIYKTDENIIISKNLYAHQKSLIALALFEKVEHFIGNGDFSDINPEKISMVTMIDLNENKLSEDFSIHWELCDCYERK